MDKGLVKIAKGLLFMALDLCTEQQKARFVQHFGPIQKIAEEQLESALLSAKAMIKRLSNKPKK